MIVIDNVVDDVSTTDTAVIVTVVHWLHANETAGTTRSLNVELLR